MAALRADTVAKVENRTAPKISRMSIFSGIYRCNALKRRYEGPWSFLHDMMWSLTSPRANRISGLYNFRSSPEKDFCNTIRVESRFPISRSFTTYCVCLELRSLPSTGVTRLPRYYEPLRHPRAPSLSLTGFRLVIADHALGLPVFRALSLCRCRRHYPGAASERIASLISSRRISLPR